MSSGALNHHEPETGDGGLKEEGRRAFLTWHNTGYGGHCGISEWLRWQHRGWPDAVELVPQGQLRQPVRGPGSPLSFVSIPISAQVPYHTCFGAHLLDRYVASLGHTHPTLPSSCHVVFPRIEAISGRRCLNVAAAARQLENWRGKCCAARVGWLPPRHQPSSPWLPVEKEKWLMLLACCVF